MKKDLELLRITSVNSYEKKRQLSIAINHLSEILNQTDFLKNHNREYHGTMLLQKEYKSKLKQVINEINNREQLCFSFGL